MCTDHHFILTGHNNCFFSIYELHEEAYFSLLKYERDQVRPYVGPKWRRLSLNAGRQWPVIYFSSRDVELIASHRFVSRQTGHSYLEENKGVLTVCELPKDVAMVPDGPDTMADEACGPVTTTVAAVGPATATVPDPGDEAINNGGR